MNKKYIFAGVVVLIVLAFGFFAFNKSASSPAQVNETLTNGTIASTTVPADTKNLITLTADGYVPQEITIQAGETITFITTTGKLHWPASNLHPSHMIYPEFDPQNPIQPDMSWSYTFTKVGKWAFHDHLAPYFIGEITVTE